MNTPVSFPIAKLLKEKEYKDKNMLGTVRLSEPEYYDPNGIIHNIKDIFEEKDYEIEDCFNAPTIVEVIMWLYEKHGIWISVDCDCYGILWYANLSVASEKNWDNIHLRHEIISASKKFPNEHNSPTEAYEAALLYTLKNLI